MRLIALPAAVLMVVLIVAGCGGGGNDNEVTASSVTKAEFIKKANAICRSAEKQGRGKLVSFVKANRFSFSTATEDEYAALVEAALIPTLKLKIKGFRALGAPEGEESQVGEIVAAFEENLEVAEKEPQEIVNTSNIVFAKANELTKEYGLTSCHQI